MTKPTLTSLARCFEGVAPSTVATVSADSEPNLAYVSHVTLLDERHVALSRQFFNKTAQNLASNPHAAIIVLDPLTFEAYELTARHERTETSGPLFETTSTRIDAIASLAGMRGVFRLIGVDVFEVLDVERVEGFITPGDAPLEPNFAADGLRTELRGLQVVSESVCRAEDLDTLLSHVLDALREFFGFEHVRVFLHECGAGKLVTIASRGYDESSIGSEIPFGVGIVGTVARERRLVRITGLKEQLAYGRAVRREADRAGESGLTEEIPLAGLPDAESAIAIPLVIGDRLLGVVAAESPTRLAFDEWDERYLQLIAHQIALGLERTLETEVDEADESLAPTSPSQVPSSPNAKKRSFVYYQNDDSMFVDGEYLIRNVPARILRRLLLHWVREGRTECSNRELRLDPSLGLPALRDNLESRLILLRKRLEEKCPDVRLERTGRGRYALVVDGPIELVERPSA